MNARFACSIVTFVTATLLPSIANAQQKKPSDIAPAEKLAEGWEEIDERLVFLVVRLANVETSLEAVEKAIASGGRKKSVKAGDAKRADRQNEELDRRGGGPVRWFDFYGTTAEKFFYHPTDQNTTYHTNTVLSQQGPQADNKVGGGVPAGQGLPVHQRPPQFDYIYRANEKSKERAEADAAELKGKIEGLTERRQRLEAEQAGLWCEIAFRAVSHYDLDKKPLYRFEPIIGVDTASRENAESMRAAASFMALAISIISEAEKDQAATFSKIKPAVAQARQNLNDTWLRLAVDVTDRKSNEGRFSALAKRLDDVASNLSDSYVVAIEGDQAKDQQRKETFRAMLQQSLVKYAQIVLALDEMSGLMKSEWKIKPDMDKPIQFVSLKSVEGVRPAAASKSETAHQPNDNTNPSSVLLGTWVERRPDTPVGDRIRTFSADGKLVLSMPKRMETFIGRWRRDGNRFYFSDSTTADAEKWFEIVEATDDWIKIKMLGQRDYTWQKATTSASTSADSVIQPSTAWSTDDRTKTLKILERQGDTFKATFGSRQIAGTIRNGKIWWLAKDVRESDGKVGGDNYGTIRGETIDFEWNWPDGRPGNTFTLHLQH